MDVEDANSTNTIESFAFRKIFIHSCSLVMFFIRDKATIFRAPPALRTPLRDIILFRVFVSFSLIRLCLSDASPLQEEEEEEESEWDIINAANYPSAKESQKERKRRKQKRVEEVTCKKKRRVLNHHFLVGKFVCRHTRLFITINLNTHIKVGKQRDKYTRNNTY
jgi:hypothetical protein